VTNLDRCGGEVIVTDKAPLDGPSAVIDHSVGDRFETPIRLAATALGSLR
jgi:hypothetical protein